MISCNSSSSSSSDEGYIDPGLTAKTVSSSKQYAFVGIGESYGAASDCNAIVFQGELNDVNYIGIAANDKYTANASPDFSIKVYWNGTAITTGSGIINLTSANYTIMVNKGVNTYTTTTDPLIMTVTNPSSGIYNFNFDAAIDVTGPAGTLTININDFIQGYKY